MKHVTSPTLFPPQGHLRFRGKLSTDRETKLYPCFVFVYFPQLYVFCIVSVSWLKQNLTNQLSSFLFTDSTPLDSVNCQVLEMSALAQALQNSCDGQNMFLCGRAVLPSKAVLVLNLFSFFFFLTRKSSSCTKCHLVMGGKQEHHTRVKGHSSLRVVTPRYLHGFTWIFKVLERVKHTAAEQRRRRF